MWWWRDDLHSVFLPDQQRLLRFCWTHLQQTDDSISQVQMRYNKTKLSCVKHVSLWPDEVLQELSAGVPSSDGLWHGGLDWVLVCGPGVWLCTASGSGSGVLDLFFQLFCFSSSVSLAHVTLSLFLTHSLLSLSLSLFSGSSLLPPCGFHWSVSTPPPLTLTVVTWLSLGGKERWYHNSGSVTIRYACA